MNIDFYSFTKRNNSTAQPSTGATTLSCQLKDETSMIAPTLVIKAVPANWSPIWNYCRIAKFNRYYFIKDWRWTNGVWECDTVVDVLASFKTQIGNLQEYVLRSSFTSNGRIVDLQYPTTTETQVAAQMLTNRFQSVFAGGYYVLGVISNDSSSAQGAVTYYLMTPAQLAALKAYMMSDTFMADQGLTVTTVTDVIPNELLKTLYNPYQYIASCVWMPFPSTDFLSSLLSLSSIAFGWFTPTDTGTTIQGYKINANGYVKTYSERISISGHPQGFDRGHFLEHSPYTERMLFYPPYGSIPINDDSIEAGDFLRLEIAVDMVLGESVLSVFHDRPLDSQGNYTDMGVLARVSAPLAVPIQLAQTTVDINGSANAMLTMAAQGTATAFVSSAASGAGTLGTLIETGKAAVNSAFSAIGDVIQNPVGQLQTSGTNGSLAQYATHPYFVKKYRIVADDDNTQKGRPLCQVKTLNTIPGYIVVDTPDAPINCMEAEREQIIAFMTSGFFYE